MIVVIALVACNVGNAPDPGPPPDWARDEAWRPQLRFSPEAGWLSDPNGLVYWNGEYHLFYQHFPDDNVWGPMHWGHAVSRDLVDWEPLPVALEPDPVLGAAWSGSAVVDGDELVLIFTHAGGEDGLQKQSIATSTDGRTFTVDPDNPVLPNPGIQADFRDPKVLRWGDGWVMLLAAGDRVSFYGSDDLRSWTWLSDFEPGFGEADLECPDLVRLTTPEGAEVDVLLVSVNPGGPWGGSGQRYYVGDFDGERFVAQSQGWADHGEDFYAGQTWSNLPGDPTWVGWANNWRYALFTPTEPWRGAMTTPRELGLARLGGQLVLTQRPHAGVSRLGHRALLDARTLDVEGAVDVAAPLAEIVATVVPGTARRVGFRVLADDAGFVTEIFWDRDANTIVVDRTASGVDSFGDVEFSAGVHSAPVGARGGEPLDLHVIIDTSSVEVFADDGRAVITDQVFPPRGATRITSFAEGGTARFEAVRVTELRTLWPADRP